MNDSTLLSMIRTFFCKQVARRRVHWLLNCAGVMSRVAGARKEDGHKTVSASSLHRPKTLIATGLKRCPRASAFSKYFAFFAFSLEEAANAACSLLPERFLTAWGWVTVMSSRIFFPSS